MSELTSGHLSCCRDGWVRRFKFLQEILQCLLAVLNSHVHQSLHFKQHFPNIQTISALQATFPKHPDHLCTSSNISQTSRPSLHFKQHFPNIQTISALQATFPKHPVPLQMNLRCSKHQSTLRHFDYLNHGKRSAVPSVRFTSHYAQYLEFDDGMNIGAPFGTTAYVSRITAYLKWSRRKALISQNE